MRPDGGATNPPIGKVISVSSAKLKHGQNERRDAKGGDCLYVGSQLVTDHSGRVALELTPVVATTGSPAPTPAPVIHLGPDSSLTLKPKRKSAHWVLELLDGWFNFFSGRTADVEVDTPYVTAGVKGTEFTLHTQDTGCKFYDDVTDSACSALWVQSGIVTARRPNTAFSDTSKITISAVGGQQTFDGKPSVVHNGIVALAGRAPEPVQLKISPDDAVNWVVHYPPLIRYQAQHCPDMAGRSDSSGMADSLRCMSPQRFAAEVDGLERQSRPVDETRLTRAAFRLLSEGNTERARTLLTRAGGADSLALLGLIALKDNNKDTARDSAARALDANRDSVNAHLVMSYVLQAEFDLEGAAEEMRAATAIEEDDPLIWARRAELALAQEYTTDALNLAVLAIEKAEAANPDARCNAPVPRPGVAAPDPVLSRAYAVLGYAQLVNLDAGEAQMSFEKARCVDEFSPLARLGLGLANIRENRLEEGVRQLEIAVALDPKVSQYRSYLGKAYFEQNRFDEAKKQLERAKQFDANDPTPWLYDAFLAQARNDPIGALIAIGKSNDLNENRAVYRSRLLLDADEAVRGAGIGRIFDGLGIDALARNEAVRALASDPRSPAAHLLMSDANRDRPRHEIASVSDLLQAQIRSKGFIVAPGARAAESRLARADIVDALDPGYGEFSRLFAREGISASVSAALGSNQTVYDEVSITGIKDKGAFSFTQFRYETDGVRPRNFRTQDYWSLLGHLQVTDDSAVQVEYRNLDDDRGEQFRAFDATDYWDDDVTDFVESWRLGWSHRISPEWDVVASFRHEDALRRITSSDGFFEFDTDQRAWQAEIQTTGRLSHLNISAGAGTYDEDRYDVDRVGGAITAEVESPVQHHNGYIYASLDPFAWLAAGQAEAPGELSLTIGVSVDDYQGFIDRKNLRPKIGLVWQANDGRVDHTFRLAYFESLKRALLANQTLEPTSVAGFTQFYDDPEATDTEVLGVGYDFSAGDILSNGDAILGGIETVHRKLDYAAFVVGPPSSAFTDDLSESTHIAYLHYVADKQWTLGIRYEREKFDRNGKTPGPESIVGMKTDRVIGTAQYSFGDVFSVAVEPAWIRQGGEFLSDTTGSFYTGDSEFLTVDVEGRWLLPNRAGQVSLKVRNLLDRDFQYQDSDPFRTRYLPSRSVMLIGTFDFH